MSQAPGLVVLTYQNRSYARLRVRGLLRNRGLARWLERGAEGALTASIGTGSVHVMLGGGRDPAGWSDWVGRRAIAYTAEEASPPQRAVVAPRKAAGRAASAPAPAPSAIGSDDGHSLPLQGLGERLALPADRMEAGLTTVAAAERLARDGANEIEDIRSRGAAEILREQFTSVPVALLAGSAALALAARAYADAGAISIVLVANGTLGFVTERRAEETVSSLRKLGPRQCTVLRDGAAVTVDARGVVAGDVLVLKPGEAVAADARVLQAHRLAVNEAALTGESLPVRKEPADDLPPGAPIGERRNMVYMGTVVSGGAGLALVVATGERTALGLIRQLAQAAESPRTQLQEELDVLARRLAIGAGVVCVAVFGMGLLWRRPLVPLLRTTVSLGVAAIPEGLPTVATSLLAGAVRSLREEGIFARRLSAVESLGAVDTVCFDKTGTLTQNRMSMASVTLGFDWVRLDEGAPVSSLPEGWLQVATLCNTLVPAEDSANRADGQVPADGWQGSATELALLRFALTHGADAARLRQDYPLQSVRHRSEHHPYMVTLHTCAQGLLVAVKGRPDEVLARCDTWFDGTAPLPLTDVARARLLDLNEQLAARGQRVLALAWRVQPEADYGETAGLCWLGMAGLADALRPDLAPMMDRFRAAGIRPMMITGDQLATAQAVAQQVGLDGDHRILDAALLPEDAGRIGAQVEGAAGFARTSPAMKLQIVRALQQAGHVVAMTGDGINDGPALKTADVGVAMGVTGTDFAHAMSDLVLRDDHPAALLGALARGRTVFLNVRKSLRYLVSTNLSELGATAIAVAAGLEEPFDPLALLWTNIATDIWPAIALGLEPPEPDVLERPPVSLKGGLLERSEWVSVAIDASVMAAASLASYGWGLVRYGPGRQARTNAFMTLTTSQLLYALSMRSAKPLRRGGLQPNPQLRRALVVTLAAQAGTVLLPFARKLLRTTPIGPVDALVVLATSAAPFAVRELLKERAP